MDNILKKMTEKAYQKYKTLPNGKPIVRQNIEADAFPIVVLDILYGEEKKKNFLEEEATELAKYVVAPPDSGIDIVVEHEDSDDYSYDFIQVKSSALPEVEIKKNLATMKRTIKDYLKKPSSVEENLVNVLGQTNFDTSYRNNCTYIVVHCGEIIYTELEKDEKIITGRELAVLKECVKGELPKVPEEAFEADSFNNFIIYDQLEIPDEDAILCNICGYDLAKLANKYLNTTLGRNILFGQNLRETLVKSKTYDGMEYTIRNEPGKFWFFNNGITVVAEDYDTENKNGDEVERFVLKNFSIINGAQTTSALGHFLKKAKLENDTNAIEQLKKVYVLTRILKVKNPKFRSDIAIYNNTQNPITTRDMASNRAEQLKLNDWLINGESPHIYVEIRRGTSIPQNVKLYKHQKTTNTELAQLAFAGFKVRPSIAKDKKNSLFDTDYSQNEYVLNQYYHEVFRYINEDDKGILFSKSKEEINELLFVQFLYKEAKKYVRKRYNERKVNTQQKYDKERDDEKRAELQNRIKDYETVSAIANICMFYCIAMYYQYKNEFDIFADSRVYNYEKFYSDKEYKEALIKEFSSLFLEQTIDIIKRVSQKAANLSTWIRVAKSEQLFLDEVKNRIDTDLTIEDKYKNYTEKFKINLEDN